jgi:hypothetical protein
MNYGNRNASSPNTTADILKGYCAAVIASCSLAMGMKYLFSGVTKGLSGGTQILANSMTSYVAVASAGFLNAYFMRRGEMDRGIKIYDKDGNEVGISKICAKSAVL